MSNGIKSEITCLLRSLHDPLYVAKFQRICGVRGAFNNSVETDAGGDGDKSSGDPWRRADVREKDKQDLCKNGTMNGKAGECVNTWHTSTPNPSNGSGKSYTHTVLYINYSLQFLFDYDTICINCLCGDRGGISCVL